jgi:hypothetical protein
LTQSHGTANSVSSSASGGGGLVGSTIGLGYLPNSFTSSGSANVGNAFKDFEKKTIDAWDIDDNDADPSSSRAKTTHLDEYFPISIADSEQVAKMIIKNHQDKQQSTPSAGNKTSSPGKQGSTVPSSIFPVVSPVTVVVSQVMSKKYQPKKLGF